MKSATVCYNVRCDFFCQIFAGLNLDWGFALRRHISSKPMMAKVAATAGPGGLAYCNCA